MLPYTSAVAQYLLIERSSDHSSATPAQSFAETVASNAFFSSAETEKEFLHACKLPLAQQNTLILKLLYEIRDALHLEWTTSKSASEPVKEVQSGSKGWSLTPALRDQISAYAYDFIISPGVRAYQDNRQNLVDRVLLAMQEMSTRGLPAEDDNIGKVALKAEIFKALSHSVVVLRERISRSMKEGFSASHIAKLACDVVQGSTMLPTLAIHHRLAFLRQVQERHFKSSHAEFWTAVDNELLGHRWEDVSPEALERYYSMCYEKDKTVYPAEEGEVVYNVAEIYDLSLRQIVINKYVGMDAV